MRINSKQVQHGAIGDYLLGIEFYERLVKELGKYRAVNRSGYLPIVAIEKAAKKAAGIEG
jgi:hypothetical protein